MKQPVLFGSGGGAGEWSSIAVVTAPVGSKVTISGGGEVIKFDGTGSSYAVPVHHKLTSYTVSVATDGQTKTDSFTTTNNAGELFYVELKFGTINLTVGAEFIAANSEITCHNQAGTKTLTPQYAGDAVGGVLVFHVPDETTWIFSGTIGSDTYTVNVLVADLDEPVSKALEVRPDGKTVLPVNDIQIWLHCGGINKPYTTLDEVLADHETLMALISDNNAVDYMVRSKTWINKGLVPIMTSNTTPSGVASDSQGTANAYKVFDGDDSTVGSLSSDSADAYVQYQFTQPTKVSEILCRTGLFTSITSAEINIFYSDDGTNFTLSDTYTMVSSEFDTDKVYEVSETGSHTYWRVSRVLSSAKGSLFKTIQFYPISEGVPENETAMRYIGKRNYAADTLLADEDWFEGIVTSDYYTSVVTSKNVPIMNGYTTPEGEVLYTSCTSSDYAWRAFDGNSSANTTGQYNTSNSDGYIGYEFVKPVIVNKATIQTHSQYYHRNFKIQYSDDGTNWADATDSVSVTANTQKTIEFGTVGAHKYWRAYGTNPAANNQYMNEIQFYGYIREDVDETLIDIYSAANDTVSITGNGLSLTCVTDATGHGTIAKSSLPVGTYIFTSSVAKDPDNLSNDYSKQIVVTGKEIEIMVMPDGEILYWYGCEINPISFFKDTNGGSLTKNTNSMSLGARTGSMYTNSIVYATEKVNLSNFNTIKALMSFDTSSGLGQHRLAYWADVSGPNSTAEAYEEVALSTSISLKSMSITAVSGEKYIGYSSDSLQISTIHALWVE